MPFVATWVDLEIVILSEVSQVGTDKCHMISLIWSLKYDTNEHIYETETFTYVENRLVVTKVGVGMGEGWIGSLGLTNANCYR